MTTVLLDIQNGCATISLNRPEKLNAINRTMLTELTRALKAAHEDPTTRVILMNGQGRSFCAGDDLVELETKPMNPSAATAFVEDLQNISRLIMLGPKTVICAVHGWAIGGGASWVLNADITLWSEDTRLKFPEAAHGLFQSGGATWILEQICGMQRAQDIMLLGDTLGIDQIIRDGFAKSAIPPEDLGKEAEVLVKRLLELPPESLQRFKSVRTQIAKGHLEEAMALEAEMMITSIKTLYETQAFPVLI